MSTPEQNRRFEEAHPGYFARYRAEHREQRRAAGRLYYETHRAEAKAYAEANKEKIRAYQEAYREAHREQRQIDMQRWAASGARKLSVQKQRAKPDYPTKNAARNKVARAKRDGRLTAMPCGECGNPNVEAHHHNGYENALDVIWLCRTHHARAHRS